MRDLPETERGKEIANFPLVPALEHIFLFMR